MHATVVPMNGHVGVQCYSCFLPHTPHTYVAQTKSLHSTVPAGHLQVFSLLTAAMYFIQHTTYISIDLFPGQVHYVLIPPAFSVIKIEMLEMCKVYKSIRLIEDGFM